MARLATKLPAKTAALTFKPGNASRAKPAALTFKPGNASRAKPAALTFQSAPRYDGLVGKTARSAVFPHWSSDSLVRVQGRIAPGRGSRGRIAPWSGGQGLSQAELAPYAAMDWAMTSRACLRL